MSMKVKNNYKNILVFNPAFLGDAVLATPLIKAVRKVLPEAKITLCVRPENADLFIKSNFIDDVIVFDKYFTQKGIAGFLKFLKIVQSYNFDLVLNLHLSIRSTILFSLLKNAYVVGFTSAVMSFLFNARIKRDWSIHEVERNLNLLKPICDDYTLEEAKQLGGKPETFIDTYIKDKVAAYLNSVVHGKKLVGLFLGSVWPTKRYPAKYFAEVASALYEKGYAVCLFGGKGDKDSVDVFLEHYKYPFFDFVYKTSLYELPAFMACMDLIIVNDTGPMHIAVSAGVTTVTIFGPTAKSLGFVPYDDTSIVVENNNVPCRPCGKHGGKKCPKKHFKCMLELMPENVINAAVSLLEKDK